MRSDIAEYTIDDCNLDEYGVLDPFRKLITRAVKSVIKTGKWFAFCKKIDDCQVDLMSIENDKGQSMGSLIANKYYSESQYRVGVYKHFMRSYMCFYEIPATKKVYDSNAYKSTYEKEIITSNVAVIAEWLGTSMADAVDKYAAYLDDAYINIEDSEIPYVRLYVKKDGTRAITKPRTRLDISKVGTRVMPAFAIKEGLDFIYENAQDKILRVSFMKDNSTIRDLDITFSPDIIRNIYGDGTYLTRGFTECYDGSFLQAETVVRGYIRAIEVGGSRYDNPLRSINICRVTKVEFDVEPDLTFIDIDMDAVVDNFEKSVDLGNVNINRILMGMKDMDLISETDASKITSAMELESWVESKNMVLGTVFLRALALFMLSDPQDFPDYTGSPVESSADSFELKKEEDSVADDIGFDFDLSGDANFSFDEE